MAEPRSRNDSRSCRAASRASDASPPNLFDQYERLLTVARKRDAQAYLMVLLGGDAGLRLGEIIGLEWRDVELGARRLTVERSEWLGHVTVPKADGRGSCR